MVQITAVPVTALLTARRGRLVRTLVLGLLREAGSGIWVSRAALALAVYGCDDRAEHEAIKTAIWRLRHEDDVAIEARRLNARRFRSAEYRLSEVRS